MKKRSLEVTHKIMASIRSKDTNPEIKFRKALWAKNIRYRKQVNIFGKPDIAIKKYKVAIFIDGDFWHGNNWKIRGLKSFAEELSNYSDFWKKKILSNIARDNEVNDYLKKEGWMVLRFWQSDIEKDIVSCTNEVFKTIYICKKNEIKR